MNQLKDKIKNLIREAFEEVLAEETTLIPIKTKNKMKPIGKNNENRATEEEYQQAIIVLKDLLTTKTFKEVNELLGRQNNLSNSHIYNWLKGKNRMTKSTYEKIMAIKK